MRIIVGALVLLCATTLASAQDGGAAPSTAAKAQRAAKPGSPRAVYEAMTLAERVAIQSDLVWTGDLNGLPDGEFGERSITAVKAYQKRQGGKETGILNPQERSQLAAAAKARQESVGWRLVGDAATGARLGLPSKLVPRADKARTGSRWQSARAEVQVETWREAGTPAATFDHHKREAGRKVTYSVLRPSLFVIAGLQGLKAFYIRAQSLDEEVRGITILYDQAMEGIMAPIVVAMAGAFQPFPAGADGPRRRVEYASGVVVGAGEIVTDRAATEACQVITIAGVGHAERLAADKASGLALLRVYGVRGLAPLPLGAPARGGEVALVGIADPEKQAGGAAVSAVTARVQANAVESAVPGFAGAAAIDERGFAGVLTQRPAPAAAAAAPQLTLAPVDAVRGLLAAHGAAARAGHAGVEHAKSSVVRVICVRR